MALSLARNLKCAKLSASRTTTRLARSKSSYKTYGTYTARAASLVSTYNNAAAEISTQVSKWWAAAAAAPLAVAAFWGTSTENKNDVETLLADAQHFEKLGEQGASEELNELARKMIASVRSMSEAEFNKHPEFIVQVVAVLGAYLASTGAPETAGVVEYLYQLARRIDAENKFPDVLRLVYRADFALQAMNQQMGMAKKLLLSELDLVRKLEKTNASMEQSDILFYLSVMCATDGDASAAKYLEESNKLFNGITTATLSPDLENYWRMAILQHLQFALTCEAENNKDMAKIFRNSSRTLYDGFKKVSPNKQNVPEFRELEVYAKMAFQKQAEMVQQ